MNTDSKYCLLKYKLNQISMEALLKNA